MARSLDTSVRQLFAISIIVTYVVFIFAAQRSARAATLIVTNLNDSGPGSLRNMVNAANYFDTITFDPNLTGTITLSEEIVLSKPVTIIGNQGIILDGNHASRIFNIIGRGIMTQKFELKNLIIQHGFASDGAGIWVGITALVLDNVIIRNNHATGVGGGIMGVDNRITITNSTIYGNSAGSGGGIFLGGSDYYSSITSSVIAGNSSSGQGAGLYISEHNLNIVASQILGNVANSNAEGGGVTSRNSTLNISDSYIAGNSARYGGGVYGYSSPITISGTLFAGNHAEVVGGGLSISGTGSSSISNSTFANNASEGSAGALNVTNNSDGAPTVSLKFTTIAYNSADTNSGGMRINAGTVTMKAVLIAQNEAVTDPDLIGNFTSQGYNLVQTKGSSTGYIPGDLPDGSNPGLDALRYNGGPTNTIALLTGSKALYAVSTAGCSDTTTDQRGYARPTSSTCDIGAFESSGTVPTPTATMTPTPTATATSTTTPAPPRADTIGIYKDGTFYLRNSNSGGSADITASFGGDLSDLPVTGDWNGDGVDTIGVYRSATGFFLLSDSNTIPATDYAILLGNPGDTPFAGKWDGLATHDGIGVFRPSNGILYAKNELMSGFSDYFAIFGNPGDFGVAGDWDSNGSDSIGIYRPSNQTWYLTNNSAPSGITFSDIDFVWSVGVGIPVAGDWDGDGDSTPGYFDGVDTIVVLHVANASIGMDTAFIFGPIGGKPVAGKWSIPSRPPLGALIQPIGSRAFTNTENGNGD